MGSPILSLPKGLCALSEKGGIKFKDQLLKDRLMRGSHGHGNV